METITAKMTGMSVISKMAMVNRLHTSALDFLYMKAAYDPPKKRNPRNTEPITNSMRFMAFEVTQLSLLTNVFVLLSFKTLALATEVSEGLPPTATHTFGHSA